MLESKISRKLTFHARRSLKEAHEIARSCDALTIEPKHLLFAILMEKGSLGSMILENIGFDRDKLESWCTPKKRAKRKSASPSTEITFSPSLKNIITRAYSLANRFSYSYVGSEHLMYALIESGDKDIQELIKSTEIEEKELKSTLKANLGSDHLAHLSKMFNLPEMPSPQKRSTEKGMQPTPFLDQYGINLMEEAEKEANIFTSRSEEIERLMHILGRKTKNNPLLIGEPGVGKTTLVNALAQKILHGEAGPILSGKKIISLDLALVVAGTNFRGEFEARLKEIIREAAAHPEIILFVDEIHTIIGAGNTSGGLDAANILKPALSKGDIQCIGATTFAEYKRHIEKDPAFERRFQPITLAEPSPEEAKTILMESKSTYEHFHNTIITEKAVDAAVTLSRRYITDRFLPDKAFDLIDEAASALRQKSPVHPLVRTLHKLEKEHLAQSKLKDKLVKQEEFEQASAIHEEERRLVLRIRKTKEQLKKIEKQNVVTIDVLDIARVVSRITGIPTEKIVSQRQSHAIKNIEEGLLKKVVGQDRALEALSETLLRSFAGIGPKDRPIGSFLFLGPSGVGKTLTAKALAETVFQDEHALIRMDMSEFMERHTVAQMIGAPAGYVGYGDGGKLTEQIRRKPYSVVLFDEIEKAHPDIFNILLQILDEGWLTDAEGRKVSFQNAVIIMTSNIGTHAFEKTARLGFQTNIPSKKKEAEFNHVEQDVLEELKHNMRPELLNRIDHIAVFKPLDREALFKIVRLELKALKSRLASQNITLRYNESIVRFLGEHSLSTDQGARLVRRNIQSMVETVAAREIVAKPDITTLSLSLDRGHIVCTGKK